MEPFKILKYPYVTEKNTKIVESENKIVFIVERKAKKQEIKQAFEELFNVKVEDVNTMITRKGKKKAIIKLNPDYLAIDVATKMGMI